jgi:hypothetical protein
MKSKITVLICILVEIISACIICGNINTKKYSSWIETPALVEDIDISGRVFAARSNQTYVSVVFVSYLTVNSKSIIFYNYTTDCKKGEQIIIKYNPENINEAVYIPYEENRVFKVRRNTVLVFFVLIVLTLLIYAIKSSNRKADDIISQLENEYYGERN